MERTYRGLGFDPTPGEVGSVTQAMAQFTEAADALDAVDPGLRRAEDLSRGWHGAAAEAFRSRLRRAPGDLEVRQRSLRQAAEVLGRWAETLGANQRRAEELDGQAVRLRRLIEAARDNLQDRQNALDLAATSAAAASASMELTAASTRIADLSVALEEVLGRARTLAGDHRRAADAAADELARIRDGDEARPAPPGQPVLRALGDLLGRASQTSTALADLVAPPRYASETVPPRAAGGAAAALAGALAAPAATGTGELEVLGEFVLRAGGDRRP
jgi:type VII secretion system ESX-1 substrate